MIVPRVAIGALSLDPGDPSGLNRYSREMLDGLMSQEGDWLTYTAAPLLRERYGAAVRLARATVVRQSNFKGNLARLLWHQTVLPVSVKRDGVSLFYSPVAEGMLAPACPQVITIHDVLPLRYPGSYRRLGHYFTHVLPRIARASTAIVVCSEATRRDIQEFYGLAGIPIHVIPAAYSEGVFRVLPESEVARVTAAFGLSSYVLSVGETRPYKNIRALIEAFARVSVPGTQLAVVGKSSKMDRSLRDLPRELGIADRVVFLGYVSDADLAALYNGAECFAFPSLYEGFGIPPLEAMACGCPVVSSNASSLPEVCGDAARYVDPTRVESIAEGLQEVCSTPSVRADLRAKGLERVKAFSYRSSTRRLKEILHRYAADR